MGAQMKPTSAIDVQHMDSGLLPSEILERLWSNQALTDVIAGLVVAIVTIPLVISFPALIFSGALSGDLSSGIGLALLAALVMGLTVALTSSYPGSVKIPQDSPAAIQALVPAAVVSGQAASRDAFATVVVTVALTSILTGLFFLRKPGYESFLSRG